MIRQAHPWFKDIVWDKLYEMEAAFKPEVNGELDTQNFMKFDEVIPNSPLLLLIIVFLSLFICYNDSYPKSKSAGGSYAST